jgi:hypothetical protein
MQKLNHIGFPGEALCRLALWRPPHANDTLNRHDDVSVFRIVLKGVVHMRTAGVFWAAGCRLALAALLAAGTNYALPISGCAEPTSIADEKTAQLLLRLISFDTSNPPGNTRALAEFLKTQFAPLGAEVEIITAPNGAATHFIARLHGDGSKKPVLLAAHADVVPVEPE